MDLFSLIALCKKILQPTVPKTLVDQYVWAVVTHVLGRTKTELMTHPPHITKSTRARVNQLLSLITVHHKPIQYILKTVPFLDLMLDLEPPVLICRPETEMLVDQVITMLKPYADQQLLFLDIGTGSGCIALSLAKAFTRSTVYAVDISPIALSLAQKNAQKNNISNVIFVQSDLFSSLDPTRSFDLIISNPPYISSAEWETLEPSVKDWEDVGALVATDEGFSILFAIIKKAKEHLNMTSILTRSGMPQLILEIGHTQQKRVKAMMQQHSFSSVTVWQDQYGKDRAVWGAL